MNTLILVQHLLSQTHLKLPENNHKRKQIKKCSILRHINTRERAKPKTIIKLFNSLVKPILIYNSEVWGAFLKPNKMRDLVQFSTYMMSPIFMKFYRISYSRYILVHKKSSSLAVKGELGVYPISINIYINIMKFFYRLGDLSTKGNYLISNCLYECYKDLYSADSSGNKKLIKSCHIFVWKQWFSTE